MASIRLSGTGRFDGEYELNVEDRSFNAREWRVIKQISGYMPATLGDGFAGRDPDLFIALGVIAMVRSGKLDRELALRAAEEIAEVPYVGQQTVELIADEVEADEVPLDLTSQPGEPSPSDSPSSSDTPTPNGKHSGTASVSDSVTSDATPSPTTA